MKELSKLTEANVYFDNLLSEIKDTKVKAIFSFGSFICRHLRNKVYMQDEDIYIVFENEKCLVVSYFFIDELCVEYRSLTEQEKERISQSIIEDYFNNTIDIYNSHTNEKDRTESISLEYDIIERITITPVISEYSKWLENGINYVSPTSETFCEIKFIMKNGNTFTIAPDDAETDGYSLLWSDEADESYPVDFNC